VPSTTAPLVDALRTADGIFCTLPDRITADVFATVPSSTLHGFGVTVVVHDVRERVRPLRQERSADVRPCSQHTGSASGSDRPRRRNTRDPTGARQICERSSSGSRRRRR
jgi:hypothetical protein